MDRFEPDLLPDDDRDLALARSLDAAPGGAAPAGAPAGSQAVEKARDPLARALASDRAARDAAPAPSPARVAALRARVLAATAEATPSPRTDRAARPPSRTRRRAFVTTLAVLVPLAVAAALLWPRAPETALLASAGRGSVAFDLADGNGRVVLAPGSRLDALPSSDGVVRVRLTGDARFDVTHRPARRFEVEAGGATVAVLGTRFRVGTSADGRVAVVLERGSVRLSSADGDAVTLAPGETATATATAVTAPEPADVIVAETDTDLAFRRSPARAVADALAARFGVVVRLPEDVADEAVTGTLVLGDTPDAALDAFGEVLGGRFVSDGGGRAYRFERSR